MYNIKGPSKIVAKTRRGNADHVIEHIFVIVLFSGISKNIENYREYNRTKSNEYEQDNVNITKFVYCKQLY